MAKGLYGAYTAAGKAGGAYKASLYDIEAVGYEKEASARMFELGEEQRERTVGAITEGISLASNVYGGIQAKKEFGEAQTAVQTGMAKKAYGESEVGKAKGATEWSELGAKGQSEWMGKFTPGEKPQAWHEKLFGADKQYRFGEEVKGEKGKDLSEYYSKSDILAEHLSSSALSLSQKTGSFQPSLSMNVKSDIGGDKDETKVKETKTETFSGVEETYDPVKDTWSETPQSNQEDYQGTYEQNIDLFKQFPGMRGKSFEERQSKWGQR